jgi:hypothetical protein
MKALLAPAVLGAFLLIVPAAQAEEVTRLDRDHGVRFTLDGAILTVRLEPQPGQSPGDIREDVWGRQIDVGCSPVFSFRARKLRRAMVTGQALWPEGQLELSYTFERDISDRVKWCLLEYGGRDVAGVSFEQFIRIYADNARDRRVGRRLRAHLLEHAEPKPWFPGRLAIVVDDTMIAISTGLRRNAHGRMVARRLCRLAAEAGVATRTTAVYGKNDAKLRSCAGIRPQAS